MDNKRQMEIIKDVEILLETALWGEGLKDGQ